MGMIVCTAIAVVLSVIAVVVCVVADSRKRKVKVSSRTERRKKNNVI